MCISKYIYVTLCRLDTHSHADSHLSLGTLNSVVQKKKLQHAARGYVSLPLWEAFSSVIIHHILLADGIKRKTPFTTAGSEGADINWWSESKHEPSRQSKMLALCVHANRRYAEVVCATCIIHTSISYILTLMLGGGRDGGGEAAVKQLDIFKPILLFAPINSSLVFGHTPHYSLTL